jgi:hypothetical protein
MKFLLILCGLLVTLGGVMVACGPQKEYCPNLQNGDCHNQGVGSGGNTGAGGMDDAGATIITGAGGQ